MEGSRLLVYKGFVGEKGYFKVNPGIDGEPVELVTEWGTAGKPGGLGANSSQ